MPLSPASAPSPRQRTYLSHPHRESKDCAKYTSELTKLLVTLERTPAAEWHQQSTLLSQLARCLRGNRHLVGANILADPHLLCRAVWRALSPQSLLGVQRKALEFLALYAHYADIDPAAPQGSEGERLEAAEVPTSTTTTTSLSPDDAAPSSAVTRGRIGAQPVPMSFQTAGYLSPLQHDHPFLLLGVLELLPHSSIQLKPELLGFIEDVARSLAPAPLRHALHALVCAALRGVEEAEGSPVYRQAVSFLHYLRAAVAGDAAPVARPALPEGAPMTGSRAQCRTGGQAFFSTLWLILRDCPELRVPALLSLRAVLADETQRVVQRGRAGAATAAAVASPAATDGVAAAGGASGAAGVGEGRSGTDGDACAEGASPHVCSSHDMEDTLMEELAVSGLEWLGCSYGAECSPAPAPCAAYGPTAAADSVSLQLHRLPHAALFACLQDSRERTQRLTLDLLLAFFPLTSPCHRLVSANGVESDDYVRRLSAAMLSTDRTRISLSAAFTFEETALLVAAAVQLLGLPTCTGGVLRRVAAWVEGKGEGGAMAAESPSAYLLSQSLTGAYTWWRRSPARALYAELGLPAVPQGGDDDTGGWEGAEGAAVAAASRNESPLAAEVTAAHYATLAASAVRALAVDAAAWEKQRMYTRRTGGEGRARESGGVACRDGHVILSLPPAAVGGRAPGSPLQRSSAGGTELGVVADWQVPLLVWARGLSRLFTYAAASRRDGGDGGDAGGWPSWDGIGNYDPPDVSGSGGGEGGAEAVGSGLHVHVAPLLVPCLCEWAVEEAALRSLWSRHPSVPPTTANGSGTVMRTALRDLLEVLPWGLVTTYKISLLTSAHAAAERLCAGAGQVAGGPPMGTALAAECVVDSLPPSPAAAAAVRESREAARLWRCLSQVYRITHLWEVELLLADEERAGAGSDTGAAPLAALLEATWGVLQRIAEISALAAQALYRYLQGARTSAGDTDAQLTRATVAVQLLDSTLQLTRQHFFDIISAIHERLRAGTGKGYLPMTTTTSAAAATSEEAPSRLPSLLSRVAVSDVTVADRMESQGFLFGLVSVSDALTSALLSLSDGADEWQGDRQAALPPSFMRDVLTVFTTSYTLTTDVASMVGQLRWRDRESMMEGAGARAEGVEVVPEPLSPRGVERCTTTREALSRWWRDLARLCAADGCADGMVVTLAQRLLAVSRSRAMPEALRAVITGSPGSPAALAADHPISPTDDGESGCGLAILQRLWRCLSTVGMGGGPTGVEVTALLEQVGMAMGDRGKPALDALMTARDPTNCERVVRFFSALLFPSDAAPASPQRGAAIMSRYFTGYYTLVQAVLPPLSLASPHDRSHRGGDESGGDTGAAAAIALSFLQRCSAAHLFMPLVCAFAGEAVAREASPMEAQARPGGGEMYGLRWSDPAQDATATVAAGYVRLTAEELTRAVHALLRLLPTARHLLCDCARTTVPRSGSLAALLRAAQGTEPTRMLTPLGEGRGPAGTSSSSGRPSKSRRKPPNMSTTSSSATVTATTSSAVGSSPANALSATPGDPPTTDAGTDILSLLTQLLLSTGRQCLVPLEAEARAARSVGAECPTETSGPLSSGHQHQRHRDPYARVRPSAAAVAGLVAAYECLNHMLALCQADPQPAAATLRAWHHSAVHTIVTVEAAALSLDPAAAVSQRVQQLLLLHIRDAAVLLSEAGSDGLTVGMHSGLSATHTAGVLARLAAVSGGEASEACPSVSTEGPVAAAAVVVETCAGGELARALERRAPVVLCLRSLYQAIADGLLACRGCVDGLHVWCDFIVGILPFLGNQLTAASHHLLSGLIGLLQSAATSAAAPPSGARTSDASLTRAAQEAVERSAVCATAYRTLARVVRYLVTVAAALEAETAARDARQRAGESSWFRSAAAEVDGGPADLWERSPVLLAARTALPSLIACLLRTLAPSPDAVLAAGVSGDEATTAAWALLRLLAHVAGPALTAGLLSQWGSTYVACEQAVRGPWVGGGQVAAVPPVCLGEWGERAPALSAAKEVSQTRAAVMAAAAERAALLLLLDGDGGVGVPLQEVVGAVEGLLRRAGVDRTQRVRLTRSTAVPRGRAVSSTTSAQPAAGEGGAGSHGRAAARTDADVRLLPPPPPTALEGEPGDCANPLLDESLTRTDLRTPLTVEALHYYYVDVLLRGFARRRAGTAAATGCFTPLVVNAVVGFIADRYTQAAPGYLTAAVQLHTLRLLLGDSLAQVADGGSVSGCSASAEYFLDKRFGFLLYRMLECLVATPLSASGDLANHLCLYHVLASVLRELVPSLAAVDVANSGTQQRITDAATAVFTRALLPTLRFGIASGSEADLVARTPLVVAALRLTRALAGLTETTARRVRAELFDLMLSAPPAAGSGGCFVPLTATALEEWAVLWRALATLTDPGRLAGGPALCRSFIDLGREKLKVSASSGGVLAAMLTSAETEAQQRTHAVRCLAFHTMALPTTAVTEREYLRFVREQMWEVLRAYGSPAAPSVTLAQLAQRRVHLAPVQAVLLLFRALLLHELSAAQLDGFWALIVPELVRALTMCVEPVPAVGGTEPPRSTPLSEGRRQELHALQLEAMKVVDAGLTISPERFASFAWVFLGDGVLGGVRGHRSPAITLSFPPCLPRLVTSLPAPGPAEPSAYPVPDLPSRRRLTTPDRDAAAMVCLPNALAEGAGVTVGSTALSASPPPLIAMCGDVLSSPARGEVVGEPAWTGGLRPALPVPAAHYVRLESARGAALTLYEHYAPGAAEGVERGLAPRAPAMVTRERRGDVWDRAYLRRLLVLDMSAVDPDTGV